MIINEAYQIDDKGVKHKMIPIEILQEIRQKIAGFRDDAEENWGYQKLLEVVEVNAYERCIDLIDDKMQELEGK